MTGSVSGVGGGMSASALKQMQEEMFKRADRNNDGSISKDELSQVAKSGDNQQGGPSVDEMFSQLDSDGDGAVSRLESDAAIAKAGQQMQSQGMRPSGPPPGPPPSEEGQSSSDSSQSDADTIFDALDTNKDGTVSPAELAAALDNASQTSSTTTTTSSNPKSLMDDLGTALQSGDLSGAKDALAALQKDVSAHNGGRSDDPFSKDLQSLSDALDSGNVSEANSVFAGIQEKMSSRPAHGGEHRHAQQDGTQDSAQDDAAAATLQAMLDAMGTSSSATSDSSTSDTLKSILTAALGSYMQQSSTGYSSSGSVSSILSATA
ncbi:EF-hand domain-containing protein [Geobacter sp. SVR]|uniref:EF-hand domain-containing protein n=1 Tax=Geobacter sp. SVR TaxID=2495594 RepID=UPI00143EFEE5|nr:EF-hand domain-containing protein [Geobacter sp. SVR]BCS55919.1 hypothetical protein GSVR_42270 [Geobacter sp. SVR]GCF84682.1 hypothetical protein GSbR_12820 [Geobacter sp. SVR]